MTKKMNLDAMSFDEMWQFHEEIGRVLSVRLIAEKRALEKRLEQLRHGKQDPTTRSSQDKKPERAAKRKYPPVYPKYQNPQEPTETWSGRGKMPRWLAAALNAGHKIEEFTIGKSIDMLVREPKNKAHIAL
jgi:DNA-binding protein H-NS